MDDLEIPVPSEQSDVVDMDLFWEQMENSVIARGLMKGTWKYTAFQVHVGSIESKD